jgi:hypothetical protein
MIIVRAVLEAVLDVIGLGRRRKRKTTNEQL